ncbi:MAG: enoyl-CoA hydratase/isomerase family protein [Chroococcidiopsidaceae cyanobacterium CP_BM_RX_35]|nr:enoyl-CoA hydratase/isomerase family protein [Chroococcidiopsidaceae cyanobacterium CP_BM_RX_35]
MSVVRFEQTGAVGQIILCDPPDNRLSREFVSHLAQAVHEASVSNSRALVVRTDGPNLGTGADVTEWPDKDVNWFHTFISELNQSYKALEALRIPTIAAVRGNCVGGHYELVLHCDLIITANTATFLAVEARTGMVPLVGGLQRLAERIGRGRTLELILLSKPLTGATAGEIGLACRVVEDSEVDAVAMKIAECLASGPTLAYGAALALMKAWSSGGIPGADDLLLDLTMRLFQTQDAQRSFQAIKKATEAGVSKLDSEKSLHIDFSGS